MSEHETDKLYDQEPLEILNERFDVPGQSPVQPHQLTEDDDFQFDCHPGVSCFNECCRNIEIQLTPYDIVRLKSHFKITSSDFVNRYSIPFELDFHGMPALRLATKAGSRECVFLGENGCTVYKDRPAACRYYALGNMGMRKKDASYVEDIFFVVKESHCQGHNEPKKQTVREYRKSQGADKYDEMNREWRDIIIKKRSSGPAVGAPSERSLQLFDMCSYDIDSFREFMQTSGFAAMFDLEDEEREKLARDDEALLHFSMRFLKQVLFGENTIPVREGAREKRKAERKDVWQQRRDEAVAAHKAKDPLEGAVD